MLIHGLRELYRRAITGEKWTSEPPRRTATGRPLIHDLLTALDLDNVRYKHYGEDIEIIRKELLQRNSKKRQCSDLFDSNSNTRDQELVVHSQSAAILHKHLFETPTHNSVSEYHIQSAGVQIDQDTACVPDFRIPNIAGPIIWQEPRQFLANSTDLGDGFNFMAFDYTDIFPKDRQATAALSRNQESI